MSAEDKVTSVEKMRKAVPEFDGTNWKDFAFSVRTTLKGNGCWKVVDPGVPPADDADDKVKADWELRNDRAYGVIALSCIKRIRNGLHKITAAKDVFAHLRKEFVSRSVPAILELEHEWEELLKKPTSPIRNWIGELEELHDRLEDLDVGLTEHKRCMKLLQHLPPQYRHFVRSQRKASIWDDLRLEIYEEERALMREEEKDAKDRQHAAFAVFTRGPASRSGGQHVSRGSKPGGARSSTNNDFSAYRCWDCEQKGHRKQECPYTAQLVAFKANLGKGTKTHQVQDTAAAASDAFPSSTPPVLAPVEISPADFDFDYAFIAASPGAVEAHEFILDTAASRHIVSDASRLIGFKAAPQGTGIRCADGGMMEVTGYGDLSVINNDGERIKLRDVAHCPSVVGNLIGGKRLTSSGFRITFEDREAHVVHTVSGKTILKAKNNGQNWIVSLSAALSDKADNALVVGSVKVDPQAAYFHKCTGHCGQRRLEAVAKSGMVIGMPSKIGNIGFCPACAAGKLARDKHPRLEVGERADRPGKKFHTDLFGPVNLQESLNGIRFGMVIACDYSHHVWFKGLTSKAQATKHLAAFHTWFTKEFPDKPVSSIRSDGALELGTQGLQEYWREHGVKHEPSPRYSPQSNGVAERAVRTITEMTRTMLIAADLPMFFWPAAAAMAAKLKNMLPATGLPNGQTPYEALYGKPPRRVELRPFGCVAWAMTPKPQRNGKFAPKSHPCIYLGPAFKGASRLWDPVKRVEVVEHSVTFDVNGDGPSLLREAQGKEARERELSAFDEGTAPLTISSRPQDQPSSSAPAPATGRPRSPMVNILQRALDQGSIPEPARATVESLAQGKHLPQAVIGQAVAILRTSMAARARTTTSDGTVRGSSGMQGSGALGAATQNSSRGGDNGHQRGEAQNAVAHHGSTVGNNGQQRGEAQNAVAQHGSTGGNNGIQGRDHDAGVGFRREEVVQNDGARSRQDGRSEDVGGEGRQERRSARLAGLEAEQMELPTSRKRKEPDDACYAVLDPSEVPYGDPRTVGEAMARADWPEWHAAMLKELRSHEERGTWEMVKAPEGANLVTSKWVLRIKRNADATIQKYKGRLVARGFTQVHGVDYDETFAPTSRLQILRLFCALSAALDMELHQIDFETAYLNAKLKHDIYMEVPEGVEALPNEVLKLRLALYGLKQSGHDWHAALRDALASIGFQQCEFDPTIFVRDGEQAAMLLVYVDDIIVATPKGENIESVKKELLGLFKGTDLGPVHHVLGIRITRDREAGTIFLDQERYAEEVLDRFGMGACKPAKTPMESKSQLRQAREGDIRCVRALYLAIVGCLAYLAQGTRPDLAFLVSALGKFNADPTVAHLEAAKRALRYLRGSSATRLVFGGNGSVEVVGFVDSDWAADKDDRRSTSGFVFTMNGGAVSWGARKQGAVALSTAEAEYIAAGVAGREALMLKGALTAAGQHCGTIKVHCDNQAAIKLVKNPGSHHDRSKHIDIVHHWIREQSMKGAFAFDYIATDLNPADAFTKALGQVKHTEHGRRIGLDFRGSS
ncbi:hypothetical protein CF319_g2861 [Tilletia indica]|nr:hypothetical protein CF319_g2861 [Tilletia indica]